MECIRQAEYTVRDKGRIVGRQRLDLFVAGTVVVELKVASQIEPIHLAQLVSYMKTLGKQVGLLFRFGGPKPEFVRRVLTAPAWSATLHLRFVASAETDNFLYPALTHEIIGGALEVFTIPIGIIVNYQTTWLEPMILRI